MSYEKDKLDSYLTSASLVTALAPYITSASVSSAIAGINLAPYVTSNSLSAAVVTDALTVRGAASVSATLAASAVTVAGFPVATTLLGYQTVDNVTSIGFSGSWSDFGILELRAAYRMSATATGSMLVFTDGGTTPILSVQSVTSPVGTNGIEFHGHVLGGNNVLLKRVRGSWFFDASNTNNYSGTATAGFVNCIRLTHSRTLSSGMAMLIGYRTT